MGKMSREHHKFLKNYFSIAIKAPFIDLKVDLILIICYNIKKVLDY